MKSSEHDPLDLASRMFTLCDMTDSEQVRQWAGEVRELLNEHIALQLERMAIENRTSKRIYELEQDNAAFKRENAKLKLALETVNALMKDVY